MLFTSPTAKNFPSELSDIALAALMRSLLDHDLLLAPDESKPSEVLPDEKCEDMPDVVEPNGEWLPRASFCERAENEDAPAMEFNGTAVGLARKKR